MQQRWKTVESISRGVRHGAFEWYGRRFGVRHGEDVLAVPVTTFAVGGTPRVVWRADLDTSLEKLLDRLDGDRNDASDASEAPPRGRLS